MYVCVCVCVYTYTRTHTAWGTRCELSAGTGHKKAQKNLDRLERSIHVDCTCVQSTYRYIYARLWGKIWAAGNQFFGCCFYMSFFPQKTKVKDLKTYQDLRSTTTIVPHIA